MDKTKRKSGDWSCFWFYKTETKNRRTSINNNVSIWLLFQHPNMLLRQKCASWPVNGLLYAIKKNKKQVRLFDKKKTLSSGAGL